ncbi:MAG: ATP-binding cassette domain-containing protein [Bdellovibrionales bacterium]
MGRKTLQGINSIFIDRNSLKTKTYQRSAAKIVGPAPAFCDHICMYVVKLKNVSIQLDDFCLKNVNFELDPGESLVLIGPSGQGKTVLLKIIAGLLQPNTGQVIVAGLDIYKATPAEREMMLYKVGMLFQKNALFDSLTCYENIAFPLREVKKVDEVTIRQKVEKFLDAVGLLHAIHLFPHEISGGMQKRLGIARALALDPEIVLYDDPTAGLDPITSRKIAAMILELQKKNNSANIIVTNEMSRAYQLATYIGMVIEGELVLTGSPAETRQNTDPRVKQFIHGQLSGPLQQ